MRAIRGNTEAKQQLFEVRAALVRNAQTAGLVLDREGDAIDHEWHAAEIPCRDVRVVALWILYQRLSQQRIEQRRLPRLRGQLQFRAVGERLGPRDLLARSQAHLQHEQADDARDEQHLYQGDAALLDHSRPDKAAESHVGALRHEHHRLLAADVDGDSLRMNASDEAVETGHPLRLQAELGQVRRLQPFVERLPAEVAETQVRQVAQHHQAVLERQCLRRKAQVHSRERRLFV